MKKILLTILSLSVFSSFAGVNYYGDKSSEAILKFAAFLELEANVKTKFADLHKNAQVREAVDYQLSFLIGHFQSASFLKKFKYPGVLSDQQEIKFLSFANLENGKKLLHYSFEGKVNFQTEAFDKSKTVKVPLRLPLNPNTIYNLGVFRNKNRCTDEHYNDESDLFYFWDVEQKDCPLKGNLKDVIRLEGEMTIIPNTKSTYPEYDRLYTSKDLNISVFLGYIEDYPKDSNKKDDGYLNYQGLSEEFLALKFKLTEEKEVGLNRSRVFEKTVRNQLGKKQKIKINMLLSDSSSDRSQFIDRFTKGLKESQIVAYDGHSGLGGFLDFQRFNLNRLPSFYQVFFFNGCSSYPYFNQMYFERKPEGKKNLEIITAGLPTFTSTSVSNMLAFLDPFIRGKIISYQTIMRRLEKSNDDEGTYLMGVNGDEDNKFRPEGKR